MLEGSNISPVQELACSVLLMLDKRNASQAQVDAYKIARAAVTDDPYRFFPTWKPPEDVIPTKEDGTPDLDNMDDANVEWSLPASDEQDTELSDWINQRMSGSVTGADLAAAAQGEWQ